LPLFSALFPAQITFIQLKYGTCSLEQDVEELDVLISTLKEKRGFREISLLGHSTGKLLASLPSSSPSPFSYIL
jgi:esterase/lipase superfamily enzyme